MRINTDVRPHDREPSINWLGGLIGGRLDARINGLEQHKRKSPLLLSYYRSTLTLEFAFSRCRQYRKKTGRLPTDVEFDPLYAFAVATHRIHGSLSPKDKAAFEGKLRGIVSDNNGARPTVYEINIAVHLMRAGWDVEFVDLCKQERLDFYAERDGMGIEVECKTTSGDTGRKIHRQEVNRLAGLMQPITDKLGETVGCHLLHLTIPGELKATDAYLGELVSLVEIAANNGSSACSEAGRVDYRLANVATWPEPRLGMHEARNFFEQLFGRASNQNIMFHSRPGHSIVALMIQSSEPDKVIDVITSEAKKASGQCSGTRPALICVQMIDPLDREQLETLLHTPNGMHEIAGTIFRDNKRSHVDSVVFTVPQECVENRNGIRQWSAPVMVLNNPTPQFPNELVRQVFRV